MVAVADRPYPEVVEQLSRRSVEKHFDAYADIDWDAPENVIHADDARFELSDRDPLGATAWYRQQDTALRARIGLHFVVHQMKVGAFFENVLSRGLLEFATTRPDNSPDYRYAYHEVIEEGQHSLMFQEFVNRSGLFTPGVGRLERFSAGFVPRLGRRFPELFFFFVLGGEAPIDTAQRETLRQQETLHPLLERIMKIHVLEEARHLCFAERYIEAHVPRLGALKRLHLQVRVPILLHFMSRQMLEAPRHLVDTYGIPTKVVREAYANNAEHEARMRRGLERIVDLARRTDVLTPTFLPLWQRLGLVERRREIARVNR